VPEPGTERMDCAEVAAYLAGVPEIAQRLGGEAGRWDVREVGDGNVNYVYIARGAAGGVCVKYAEPFVRAIGAAWPLTVERGFFEYRALAEHHRVASDHVPQPLRYDADRRILVVEELSGHRLVRHELAGGTPHPDFADHMAEYLARSLCLTSDLALPAGRKRRLAAVFAGNVEMCQIMEEMVFTDPYREHPRNHHTAGMDAEAIGLREDVELKLAVARMKVRYLSGWEALAHGDLHLGSIMVSDRATHVIDQEFACFAPIGFDIGTLAAHLLMTAFALPPRRDWALTTLAAIWTGFDERFRSLCASQRDGDAYAADLFAAANERAALASAHRLHMAGVLADALGFCGAEIVRRLFGFARCAELESIEDPAARAAAERRCLALARALLLERGRFLSMDAVVTTTRGLMTR
jgi:5-methylthioribose kinase